MAQCFAAMTTGRPRPAYLEIPLDLLDAAAEVAAVAPVQSGAATPTADAVRRAATLIAAAERPLVIAGGGSSAAAAELRDFAEVLGAPVITTANGKGVLVRASPALARRRSAPSAPSPSWSPTATCVAGCRHRARAARTCGTARCGPRAS